MSGTWQALRRQPGFCASTMLLLTDGTVMVQQENGRQWWRLTPDGAGSYVNGTWTKLASMRLPRLYYASAVLADGRVFVLGGEYSGGTDAVELASGEIYDPLLDVWMDLPTPDGWDEIGDAASCMLADGRIIVGNLDDTRTAIFTPGPDTWAAGPDKEDSSSEESWALLPDGTVLTAECSNGQKTEKYVPTTNTWVTAGQTPVMLVEAASSEIGPAALLPDGRCIFIGATGNTALYTPPANPQDAGTWTAGPSFPNSGGQTLGAKDAPGAVLPTGNFLCVAAPVTGNKDDYLTPTSFFEFDGASLARVADPPNNGGPPYKGRLLVVPSGEVLFSAATPEIYAYTPDGAPNDEWRPVVDCPKLVTADSSFVLFGQRFNGMTQASVYGDDATVATNYPIVRLTTSTGRVVFCRTSDHSTMGVATGNMQVATTVAVPADVEDGPAELVVIANGIPSEPCMVEVVGGRDVRGGRGGRGFRDDNIPRPKPEKSPKPQRQTAKRGFLDTIGLGLRYVGCGFYYVCNWAAQLTCAKTETESYAQCAQTEDQGYNQCTQTRDDGYNKCTQTRDDGYNKCTQTRDEGYKDCCDWWPCSWLCDAWVWVSNIVCVAWTWVSNIVCVAWTWVSNIVCVAWTWIVHLVCVVWTWVVAIVCKAFVWVMKLICN